VGLVYYCVISRHYDRYKIVDFGAVITFSIAGDYRCFGAVICLLLQGCNVRFEESVALLKKVGTLQEKERQ
jgi:hypothetical protein